MQNRLITGRIGELSPYRFDLIAWPEPRKLHIKPLILLTPPKRLFTIGTKPIALGKNIIQVLITIGMTAIKVTHITNHKHMIIIPPITNIANIIIQLTKLHIPLLNLNDLFCLDGVFQCY